MTTDTQHQARRYGPREKGLSSLPFSYGLRHYFPVGLKPRTLKPLLIAARGDRCAHCGAEGVHLDVEHIVPIRVRHGAAADEMLWVYAIENTQLLCKACHKEKGRIDETLYPKRSKLCGEQPSRLLMEERVIRDAVWPLWRPK